MVSLFSVTQIFFGQFELHYKMNNKRNAGRPASIIELHLNNFDATIEKIQGLNEKSKLRVLKLCSEIQNTLSSSSSIGTQTAPPPKFGDLSQSSGSPSPKLWDPY